MWCNHQKSGLNQAEKNKVYVTNKNNVKTWGYFMALTGKLFRTSLSVWVVEIRVKRLSFFWWENINDNYLYIYRYIDATRQTKKCCTFRSTTAFLKVRSSAMTWNPCSFQSLGIASDGEHLLGFLGSCISAGFAEDLAAPKKSRWSESMMVCEFFFNYPTNLRLLIPSSLDRQWVHPAVF